MKTLSIPPKHDYQVDLCPACRKEMIHVSESTCKACGEEIVWKMPKAYNPRNYK